MNVETIAQKAVALASAVNRLDAFEHRLIADQADSLLTRVAQAVNNPVQQQLQTLMFNMTQLSSRLKQIEDSLSAANNAAQPAQAMEMAQSAQLNTIESQQQDMQAQLQQFNTNNTNAPVTHQMDDYQVTVSPKL